MCCGSCEGCPQWGGGGMELGRYCGYCEIQFDLDRMCWRDDNQQLHQAGEKVRQLGAELKRARETYDFMQAALSSGTGSRF